MLLQPVLPLKHPQGLLAEGVATLNTTPKSVDKLSKISLFVNYKDLRKLNLPVEEADTPQAQVHCLGLPFFEPLEVAAQDHC